MKTKAPLKKVYLLILVVLLLLAQTAPAWAAEPQPPTIKAKSAIVIDADTGEILYEKASHTQREPASVTKIMTCLLALEHLDLDQVITVTGPVETMGTVMELKQGEQLTVEQLLYGLMLVSANDAAEVLAKEVSGSIEAFAELMTARARACGAQNTQYRNPNGLNWEWQRQDHVTTAYDMAMITQEAMKNGIFRKLVSTVTYTVPATNKSGPRKLRNTNHSLWNDKTKLLVNGETKVPKYEGVIGVKTGLTSTAGACLVGAIDRHGTKLISVVLFSGNKERYSDSIALWDYSLEKAYRTYELVGQGEEVDQLRVKRGAVRNVSAIAEEAAKGTIPKDTSEETLHMEFFPKKLHAPVEKGQVVGTIKVYHENKEVSSVNAVAAESVEVGGILSVFGIPNWMAMAIYVLIILVLLIIFIYRMIQRSAAKRRERRMRKRQKQKNRMRYKEQQRRRR